MFWLESKCIHEIYDHRQRLLPHGLMFGVGLLAYSLREHEIFEAASLQAEQVRIGGERTVIHELWRENAKTVNKIALQGVAGEPLGKIKWTCSDLQLAFI